MIFNEIKCCVNTSLGLVGGMHSPLCPRLPLIGYVHTCGRALIKTLWLQYTDISILILVENRTERRVSIIGLRGWQQPRREPRPGTGPRGIFYRAAMAWVRIQRGACVLLLCDIYLPHLEGWSVKILHAVY